MNGKYYMAQKKKRKTIAARAIIAKNFLLNYAGKQTKIELSIGSVSTVMHHSDINTRRY